MVFVGTPCAVVPHPCILAHTPNQPTYGSAGTARSLRRPFLAASRLLPLRAGATMSQSGCMQRVAGVLDPVVLSPEQLAVGLGEEASEGLFSGYGAAYDPERALARSRRDSERVDTEDELDALVNLPDATTLPAPTITPQTSAAELTDHGSKALKA